MTDKEIYSRTPEQILQRITAEGRTPTEEENELIACKTADLNNSVRERLGDPIPEEYSPYNWQKMHELETRPLFIAGGALSCLMFQKIGYDAAEYRAGLRERFLQDLDSFPPSRPLIIALNRDASGDQEQQLYSVLQSRKIECYLINVFGKSRSAAEAFLNNEADFRISAEKAIKDPRKAQHMQRSAGGFLDTFLNEIRSSLNDPPISTGFSKLDRLIDGGLRPALYALQALPNIGKSALLLQIADQIAEYSGKDIVYITLEMSRGEHMARTLSRLTMRQVQHEGRPNADARSSAEIMDAYRYKSYTADQSRIISDAIEHYRKFADHIYFLEGSGITAEQIRRAVLQHIAITKNKPVVIVDYLQIIAPEDSKTETRISTDRNINILANMAKSLRLPVIVISAVNRASYNSGSLTLGSSKESSGIEYGADVVLSFQYRQNGTEKINLDEEKAKNPRTLELKLEKNRLGAGYGKAYLNYQPRFNLFTETN